MSSKQTPPDSPQSLRDRALALFAKSQKAAAEVPNQLRRASEFTLQDLKPSRFTVKKIVRHGAALTTAATGLEALRLQTSRVLPERVSFGPLRKGPLVRVLTYHRIGDDEADAFCVHRGDFEAQMQRLAESGRAISLEQLEAFLVGKGTLPEDACLVTLDDGNISNLTEALPILRRWNVPAVCFVTSSLIGADFSSSADSGGAVERFLTWDELRALDSSELITIGSHAETHRSLGLMPDADAKDEAQRSKQALEEGLGHEVRSFAYPFGTRSDFSPRTDRHLADAGYTIAFNSMHGAISHGADPISLPRVKVEGGEGLWMFDRVSRGAMDSWRLVDANLWRLQRVRREVTQDGVA